MRNYTIKTPVYFLCAGCTSLYAEALSWANANPETVTSDLNLAKSVVVLGCQVTDLAVLNDMQILEKLSSSFAKTNIYVSGCLGRREDIPLPKGIRRLANMRSDYQILYDFNLVQWADPFWLKPEDKDDHIKNRFRDDYPLRIGVGCHGTCAFCTIRKTRGIAYDLDSVTQLAEAAQAMKTGKGITLTADSPKAKIIRNWLKLGGRFGMLGAWSKNLSLKNVEPHVMLSMKDDLIEAANFGALRTVHSPTQNPNSNAADIMNRAPIKPEFFDLIQKLKDSDVKCATNIIIDYPGLDNPTDKEMSLWDIVDWNPYWDGIWDREKAEQRMAKYFPWKGEQK